MIADFGGTDHPCVGYGDAVDGLQFSLQSLSIAPDALLLLLAALVLDAGIPLRLRPQGRQWNPFRWLESATQVLERRLNRADRSPGKRLFRGAIVVIILLAGAWGVGWSVTALADRAPFGWVFLLAFLTALVVQRRPIEEARGIRRALQQDGLRAGQQEAALVLGGRAAALDASGLCRHTTAYLGERLGTGLVGAVFWYVLLGLPGLLTYRAVRVAGQMLPESSDRFESFGMAATRLSGVVVLIPSMLAGALIAAAALFTPGAAPGRAIGVMGSDRGKHVPPVLGWPVAAMSGALGLAFGGAAFASAGTGSRAVVTWIGESAGGRMDARPDDITRALYLYGVTGLLTFGLVAVLALARFMT